MKAHTTSSNNQSGFGCLPLLIIATFMFLGIAVMGNWGMGYYGANCADEPVIDCFLHNTEKQPEEGSVTATGPYSFSGYTITVTAHFPLSGGSVTGTVTGDCTGQLRGTYDGANNGVISGPITGTCSVYGANVPARATYTGVVNKDVRMVPIEFTGSGGGFSHTGSMSLSY